MKKTVLCIVGRTASGKDYMAKRLSVILDIPQVVSHTTRPKRENETNGVEHWFDDEETFKKLLETEKIIAYTKIGDYEYCATLNDVGNEAIYVIDPKGLEHLKKFTTTMKLKIVYVYCDDYIREARASIRSDFRTEWNKRNKAEDAMFTEFESKCKWHLLIDNGRNINMKKLANKVRKLLE